MANDLNINNNTKQNNAESHLKISCNNNSTTNNNNNNNNFTTTTTNNNVKKDTECNDPDTIRFIVVICLTLSYFFIELVCGHVFNSLALVADSFHMLSDVIALIIGLVARIMQRRSRATKKFTFGLQRAEIVGTAVNTVMLLTLVFTIFLEAISRFIERSCVKEPKLMMGVGGAGLLINFVSLLVLSCGGDGGHGHSHGGGGTGKVHKHNKTPSAIEKIQGPMKMIENDIMADEILRENDSSELVCEMAETSYINRESHHHHDHDHNDDDKESLTVKMSPETSRQQKRGMALRGVLLHVMADMFGSVVVVISACIIYFVPPGPRVIGDGSEGEDFCSGNASWKMLIDPSLSLCLVALVAVTTFPLAYKSFKILFQSVPKEVNITLLRKDMKNVKKAHNIHDLHVWRLHTDSVIGTVHVNCKDANDFVEVTKEIRNIFHLYGVHSTTIQPEFDEDVASSEADKRCMLDCTDKCNKQ